MAPDPQLGPESTCYSNGCQSQVLPPAWHVLVLAFHFLCGCVVGCFLLLLLLFCLSFSRLLFKKKKIDTVVGNFQSRNNPLPAAASPSAGRCWAPTCRTPTAGTQVVPLGSACLRMLCNGGGTLGLGAGWPGRLWQSEGTTEAEPGCRDPQWAGTGENELRLGMGVPTRQGAGWAVRRPNSISQPSAGRAGTSSPGAEAVPKGWCDGKH